MELTVSPDVGKRLDVYVAEREGISRSASQKLIENGMVSVSGRTVAKNYRIRQGDEIECELPDPVPLDAEPENIPLDIVYEDDSLLVVNKPKGMVVHPAPGNYTGTLVNALLYHCGSSLSGINGVIRPGIVHRIDKNTSGLLVVAKNDKAHESLAVQISQHSFERCYHSIVCGNIKTDEGRVDAPIYRHPVDRKKMAIVPGGRPAATNYRVLERFEGATYLELRLETGRTHQIRVHMEHIGHSVLGDTVYGGTRTKLGKKYEARLQGQCLHAKTISFIHPETNQLMRFESELPEYFSSVLSELK